MVQWQWIIDLGKVYRNGETVPLEFLLLTELFLVFFVSS